MLRGIGQRIAFLCFVTGPAPLIDLLGRQDKRAFRPV
jgi:hypothetical protein